MITTPLDASAWSLAFDAKVQTDSGVSFHAGYDGQLGDKSEIHTGSISVRWKF
ncbi:autotransporter outer membrane beta-barrel domain-containing protein [Brevundimonas sp. P7753]|nr:autotransporter outer membrane beta-barrel domain-containing protein [Brevundimonas sp. P7753]